jgi:hypothetical protein
VLHPELSLNHYYINRSWLISPTARRVYRIAAGCSLLVVLVPIIYALEGEALFRNALTLDLVRLALLLGVFGTATTLVAMEYYYFTLDDCGAWTKTFWFLVVSFAPIGTALYCFRVYSRSKYFQQENSAIARAVST